MGSSFTQSIQVSAILTSDGLHSDDGLSLGPQKGCRRVEVWQRTRRTVQLGLGPAAAAVSAWHACGGCAWSERSCEGSSRKGSVTVNNKRSLALNRVRPCSAPFKVMLYLANPTHIQVPLAFDAELRGRTEKKNGSNAMQPVPFKEIKPSVSNDGMYYEKK
jgi:hypothetical protein